MRRILPACRACRPTISTTHYSRRHLSRPCRIITSNHPNQRSQSTVSAVSAAALSFGQPLHETHPHILQSGELTPGITAAEYHARRARLSRSLPRPPPGKTTLAVLKGAKVRYRRGAAFYEFAQDADFEYLTGFNEPDAAAIIERDADDFVFHLFVRPKDIQAERWDGARSGVQAALDVFNADEAASIEEFPTRLATLAGSAETVYTKTPLEGVKDPHKLKPLINDLRAFKSDAEVSNMRIAGRESGRAITSAMRQTWRDEKSLAAFLEYEFKRRVDGSAYVPVVAGGDHGLSIHYVRNDDVLRDGEMVLVDAGGEHGGYIADITRVWPTTSRFTAAQRDLYSAVLGVQRECVSLCRADAGMSLDSLHDHAEGGLSDALKQLGFDLGRKGASQLFPHHLGHFVGLEIHDTPGYSRNAPLKARQCITIEPGVYVPDDERWPAHFRGMAVRIEDSVCVQDTSPLVLTTEAVKEVDDIEALRTEL